MEKKNQRGSKLNRSNYITYLVGEALKDIDPPGQVSQISDNVNTSNESFLEQLCAVPQNPTNQSHINSAIPPTGYQYATQDQLDYISPPRNPPAPGYHSDINQIVPNVVSNPEFGVGFGSSVTYIPPVSPPIQPAVTYPSAPALPIQPVPVGLYMNPALVNQIEPAVSYRSNHSLEGPLDIHNSQQVNNTIQVQSNFDNCDRFAIRSKAGNVSNVSKEYISELTNDIFNHSSQFTEAEKRSDYQSAFNTAVNAVTGRNQPTVYRGQQDTHDTSKTNFSSPTLAGLSGGNVNMSERGDSNKFQCNICGANQESAFSLSVHKAIHTIGQTMESMEPNMELVCGECGLNFANSTALTSHIQTNHFSNKNQDNVETVFDGGPAEDVVSVGSRRKAENEYFSNFMVSEKNKEETIKKQDNMDMHNHDNVANNTVCNTNKWTSKTNYFSHKERQNGSNPPITVAVNGVEKDLSSRQRVRRTKSSEVEIRSEQSSNTVGRRKPSAGGRRLGSKTVRNTTDVNIGTGRSGNTGTVKKMSNHEEKKTQFGTRNSAGDRNESDSDVELIEQPIEIIVLDDPDDDSPTEQQASTNNGTVLSASLMSNETAMNPGHQETSSVHTRVATTREKDKELMEKYGLKDLSIKILKKSPTKQSSHCVKDTNFTTLPKASNAPIANLSDIASSDLDKMLRECGMGITVPERVSYNESRKRDTSPKPSTSKPGSDDDYRPVKRPLSYISPAEQKLMAKYGIKEAKVIVGKTSDTPRKTLPKSKTNLETNSKPSWLSHNFDSDVSSDFELDIPSPTVDAENDEGYDADTDSCIVSVKNDKNKNSCNVPVHHAKTNVKDTVKPKTNDEILLQKFGIKNALVLMSNKNDGKKDSTKSDSLKEPEAKQNESKTLYKKARQASDIKMTRSSRSGCVDAKITPVSPSEIVSATEPPRKKIKAAKNRVSEMIVQNKLDTCYTGLTEDELFIKYDIKFCEVVVKKDDVQVACTETKFKEPRALRSTQKQSSNMTRGSKEVNCLKRSNNEIVTESPAKKLRSSPRKDPNSSCTDKNARASNDLTKQIQTQSSRKSKVIENVADKLKESPQRTLRSIARNENVRNNDQLSRNAKGRTIIKGSDPLKATKNVVEHVSKKSPVKKNSREKNQAVIEIIDLTEDDSNLLMKTSPNQRKSKSVSNAIKTLNKAQVSPHSKKGKQQLQKSPVKSVRTLPQRVSVAKIGKSVMKVKLPVPVTKKQLTSRLSKCDENTKAVERSATSKHLKNDSDAKVVIKKLNQESIGKIKEDLRKEITPTKQNKSSEDDAGSIIVKEGNICRISPIVNIVRLKASDLRKSFDLTDVNSNECRGETGSRSSIEKIVNNILTELVDNVLKDVRSESSKETDSEMDNATISDAYDDSAGVKKDLDNTGNMSEGDKGDEKMEVDVFPDDSEEPVEKTCEIDSDFDHVSACSEDNGVIHDVDKCIEDEDDPLESAIEKEILKIENNETTERNDTALKNYLNDSDIEENDSVEKYDSSWKAEDESYFTKVDHEIENCSSDKCDSSGSEIAVILKDQNTDDFQEDGQRNQNDGDSLKTNCVSPAFQGVVVDESDGSVCGEFTVNEVPTKDTTQLDCDKNSGKELLQKTNACERSSKNVDRHHIDDEIHVLSQTE